MKYLLLFLLCSSTALAQFIVPIEGVQNRDWFITNYIDHDTAEGTFKDYWCGKETYDQHQGTDFFLRDFRQMDSGVFILAAAAGRVYFTHDGEFDRSKHLRNGGLGNHIVIYHNDSLYTLYAHLRKSGLLVKIGDSVTQGQRIAYVASSGWTNNPHLHFEVHKRETLLDPFGTNCQNLPKAPGRFISPPYYDDSFKIITGGLTSGMPSLELLGEHPNDISTFTPTEDTIITCWLHGLSWKPEDKIRYDWFTPSDNLWNSFTDSPGVYYRYWYSWTYIYGPKKIFMPQGLWKVKCYKNDSLLTVIPFRVGSP